MLNHNIIRSISNKLNFIERPRFKYCSRLTYYSIEIKKFELADYDSRLKELVKYVSNLKKNNYHS